MKLWQNALGRGIMTAAIAAVFICGELLWLGAHSVPPPGGSYRMGWYHYTPQAAKAAGISIEQCDFFSSAPGALTATDAYPCRMDASHGIYQFVDNWPASQAVTGTFWQATQPVSGTFWQATQPVSGTFWQATQPVSLASLPSLPAGTNAIGTVQIPDTRSIGNSLNGATLNATTSIAISGEGAVGIQLVGLTASAATLTFKASADNGTTYRAVTATRESTGAQTQTAVVDDLYRIVAGGYTNVEVQVTNAGAGTITVSFAASVASSADLQAGANTGQYRVTPPTLSDLQNTPLMTDSKGLLLLSPQSTVATAEYLASLPSYSASTLNPLTQDQQGRAYLTPAARTLANTTKILTPASPTTCTAIDANATYLAQVINASAAAETAELKIFNNSSCTVVATNGKIYDATLSSSSPPITNIPLPSVGLWYTLSAAASDNIVITYVVPTNS